MASDLDSKGRIDVNLKRLAAVGLLAFIAAKQYPAVRRYLQMEKM